MAAKAVKAEAKVVKQEEKRIAAEKRKTQPPGSTNEGAPAKARPKMDETPVGVPKRTRSLPPKGEGAEEIEYPKPAKAKARARSSTQDLVPVPKEAVKTTKKGGGAGRLSMRKK